jgi:hypothetical protein
VARPRGYGIALDIGAIYGIVLPYMASLVSKKKGHKLYYYLVESQWHSDNPDRRGQINREPEVLEILAG